MNVALEVANESTPWYVRDVLKPDRIPELIERAQNIKRDGQSYSVSTSVRPGTTPRKEAVDVSD
jgi:hypothetical protein